MGLKSDLQTDIAEAFDDDLADAVRVLTYREISRTIDPTTNLSTEVNTDYTTRGVVGRFTTHDLRDSNILPTDSKITILQNELEATPQIEAHIFDAINIYTIIKIRQDPAKATWSLQCRQ